MIARITYKTEQHYDYYCVPEEDISSGEFRRIFEPVWSDHLDVTEFYQQGLIVTMPKGTALEVPEVHFDVSKSKLKAKEVFEACHETGC